MPVFSAPRISVHAGVVAVRVNIFLGEAEDALDLESRASEDSLTQFIDVGLSLPKTEAEFFPRRVVVGGCLMARGINLYKSQKVRIGKDRKTVKNIMKIR